MATSAHRILVVDDVSTNRELARRILVAQGYEVDTAVDGSSALEMIVSQRFDLVLLDIQMPGLDGFEVCRIIRQQTAAADLRVILLSATDQSADILSKSKEAGATSFLTKPFSIEELTQAVAEVFE